VFFAKDVRDDGPSRPEAWLAHPVSPFTRLRSQAPRKRVKVAPFSPDRAIRGVESLVAGVQAFVFRMASFIHS
jgi:hypothetical protein